MAWLDRAHSVGCEAVLNVLFKVRIGCGHRVDLGPFACALAGCPFFLGTELEHLLDVRTS